MGMADAGKGLVVLIGLVVWLAVVVTAIVGLISRSRSFAGTSVLLAMLPIWACGMGLWARPGEARLWFPLVWILQLAIIATLLLPLRFRTVAVTAFPLLCLLLAVWLVTWPAEDYLHIWAGVWALGIALSVASASRAFFPR